MPACFAILFATSLLSPVNIFVFIPSFFNFSIAIFASFLISSASTIFPTVLSFMLKYRTVSSLFNFLLFPANSSFPIFICFPSISYCSPFPDTSLKLITFFVSILEPAFFNIDFAIGWFEKLSPIAK